MKTLGTFNLNVDGMVYMYGNDEYHGVECECDWIHRRHSKNLLLGIMSPLAILALVHRAHPECAGKAYTLSSYAHVTVRGLSVVAAQSSIVQRSFCSISGRFCRCRLC